MPFTPSYSPFILLVEAYGVQRGSVTFCAFKFKYPIKVIKPDFDANQSILNKLKTLNYDEHSEEEMLVIDTGENNIFKNFAEGEWLSKYDAWESPPPLFIKTPRKVPKNLPLGVLQINNEGITSLAISFVKSFTIDFDRIMYIFCGEYMYIIYFGEFFLLPYKSVSNPNSLCFQALCDLADEFIPMITKTYWENLLISPKYESRFTDGQIKEWITKYDIPSQSSAHLVDYLIRLYALRVWPRARIPVLENILKGGREEYVRKVLLVIYDVLLLHVQILGDPYEEHWNKLIDVVGKWPNSDLIRAALFAFMLLLKEKFWIKYTNTLREDLYDFKERYVQLFTGFDSNICKLLANEEERKIFLESIIKEENFRIDTDILRRMENDKRFNLIPCLRLANQRHVFTEYSRTVWNDWQTLYEMLVMELTRQKIYWIMMLHVQYIKYEDDLLTLTTLEKWYKGYKVLEYEPYFKMCEYSLKFLHEITPNNCLGLLYNVKEKYVSSTVISWKYYMRYKTQGGIVDSVRKDCPQWIPLYINDNFWKRMPLAMHMINYNNCRNVIKHILNLSCMNKILGEKQVEIIKELLRVYHLVFEEEDQSFLLKVYFNLCHGIRDEPPKWF